MFFCVTFLLVKAMGMYVKSTGFLHIFLLSEILASCSHEFKMLVYKRYELISAFESDLFIDATAGFRR